jgi:DNA-binding IclR family transcriptional regulator
MERVVRLSKLFAAYDSRGMTLSDVARSLSLPVTTAHRLLREMTDLGLVARIEHHRRFVLGPVIYEFGLAASARHDVRRVAGPLLDVLVAVTDLPAYLFGISGTESVCLERVEPAAKGTKAGLKVGGRRPLGVGASGLALLSALGDEQVEASLAAHAADFGKFGGLTVARVRELVAQTRQLGYAASGGCLDNNTAAVGLAILDDQQQPVLAISLSSTVARLRKAERERLVATIKETLQRAAVWPALRQLREIRASAISRGPRPPPRTRPG